MPEGDVGDVWRMRMGSIMALLNDNSASTKWVLETNNEQVRPARHLAYARAMPSVAGARAAAGRKRRLRARPYVPAGLRPLMGSLTGRHRPLMGGLSRALHGGRPTAIIYEGLSFMTCFKHAPERPRAPCPSLPHRTPYRAGGPRPCFMTRPPTTISPGQ